MNKEFRDYIRMLVSEVLAENTSVSSRLVSSEETKKDSEMDEEDKLDEFSGVGAIAGYALPLGMTPDFPISGSKKRKKNPKRKNPSWA